ncbi:MAG TPA: hypothetical protein VFG54_09565 [Prolixibacteraceae bacterium]|nr:hypothetical protein [Prolixibacteraceae bacterium]
MFLFGILSSPLPYLLIAAFYFFGFATGMFHKEVADSDEDLQTQVKNIQAEPLAEKLVKTENDFHFYQYDFKKKFVDCAVQSIQPPPDRQKEKIIYFVHELKIPHSSLSDFYFCRPPPSVS